MSDKFRNNDPDTSKEAGKIIEIRLTDIQYDVYQFFLKQPDNSATDEELEDALMFKYPAWSTARKRRTELYHKGLLYDPGIRRKNRNNRNMIVWKLV